MDMDEVFTLLNEKIEQMGIRQRVDIEDSFLYLTLKAIKKKDMAYAMQMIEKLRRYEVKAKTEWHKSFFNTLHNIISLSYDIGDGTNKKDFLNSLKTTLAQLERLLQNKED